VSARRTGSLPAVRTELQPFVEEIRAAVPAGAEIVDVHTHLGVDEDGRSLAPDALLRQMDRCGIARSCVFPLHDPDRLPAYRIPNDRVLEWAAEHPDRFVPFCRLDPADGAAEEAERCLRLGARGIKLHPRAQAFDFDRGVTDRVFGLAAEAGVPVLVHAGRGMPPIADGLCDVALRHPGAPLVLAHGGIADQAVFATRLAEHPSAVFDTSVFGPVDLMELFARVPVERIVFGSDPPYGRVMLGLFLTVRAATASGATADQMRGLLGGTAASLLTGAPLPPPTRPLRPRVMALPGALLRLASYLTAAFTSCVRGEPGAAESVELALSVCRDPDPGAAEPALARIAPLLREVMAALDDPATTSVPVDLLYLAMSIAVTETPADG
jgi:uncharacterized protein